MEFNPICLYVRNLFRLDRIVHYHRLMVLATANDDALRHNYCPSTSFYYIIIIIIIHIVVTIIVTVVVIIVIIIIVIAIVGVGFPFAEHSSLKFSVNGCAVTDVPR